jgi:alkylhydroperoxidase/carboxymuconolactone decarboxylase family protein YurZ
LLEACTANQTKLSGGPMKGHLFDFAPAIDECLKTHLFEDVFERDNLDWQSRELATVGMLSALPGAESRLQSHMRISMNVGITATRLDQLTQVLADRVDAETARRALEALRRQLATRTWGLKQCASPHDERQVLLSPTAALERKAVFQ